MESEYHLQSKPGKEGGKLEWVKISFGMGTLKLETVVKVKVLYSICSSSNIEMNLM